MSLEAATADLVCRVAPRLLIYLEEYPEAGLARTSHSKVEAISSTRSGNR